MQYWQLDVFAERPLAGNGLAVFDDARGLSASAMQGLTQELRQFESIFLLPGADASHYRARIFTLEEELPFAGHPIIGAAALLHHLHSPAEEANWQLQLTAKTVQIHTQRLPQGFYAEMDQGVAEFGAQLSQAQAGELASAFGLDHHEQDLRYPAMVVSTGLPYVLLPVTSAGLAKAKQRRALDLELQAYGAAFVFLLDIDAREGRTWDPAGVIEDIATGSAAGPVAAYLVAHDLALRGASWQLNQGRFLQRPSRLQVCVGSDERVRVGGHVQLLARAQLLIDPASL